MGIDAVSRQAKANVAVFGLNALAIEVVKNIVLSGCRKITLIDDSNVTWRDLAGQFFFSESDVGKNRVASCLHKIQELNYYVKVDRLGYDLTDLNKFKEYTVIVVT
jgi:molybdopterin/thiamine biosynthesis adenylyltransferase